MDSATFRDYVANFDQNAEMSQLEQALYQRSVNLLVQSNSAEALDVDSEDFLELGKELLDSLTKGVHFIPGVEKAAIEKHMVIQLQAMEPDESKYSREALMRTKNIETGRPIVYDGSKRFGDFVPTTVKRQSAIDSSGEEVSIDSFLENGKTLIVNFSATWCAPCVEEIQELKRIQTEHGDEVQILTIAVQQPNEYRIGAKRLSARGIDMDLNYPVLFDPDYSLYGHLLGSVSQKSVPGFVFVTSDGDAVRGCIGIPKFHKNLEDFIN